MIIVLTVSVVIYATTPNVVHVKNWGRGMPFLTQRKRRGKRRELTVATSPNVKFSLD